VFLLPELPNQESIFAKIKSSDVLPSGDANESLKQRWDIIPKKENITSFSEDFFLFLGFT
jgi:hypothetical protein